MGGAGSRPVKAHPETTDGDTALVEKLQLAEKRESSLREQLALLRSQSSPSLVADPKKTPPAIKRAPAAAQRKKRLKGQSSRSLDRTSAKAMVPLMRRASLRSVDLEAPQRSKHCNSAGKNTAQNLAKNRLNIQNIKTSSTIKNPKRVGIVLFTGFELLDAFGPLEMFGLLSRLEPIEIVTISYAFKVGKLQPYKSPTSSTQALLDNKIVQAVRVCL